MNPSATPQQPAGGYQNGGWYNGRQYWNGQFGTPGQIINPNQQGAGQVVSPEVQAQSDPNSIIAPSNQGGLVGNQSGLGSFMNPNGTPDLLGIYGSTNPDIQNVESQITQAQKAQANTAGMINENPFYSEALRTGKLENMYNMSNQTLGVLQNQLALKQADQKRAIDVATGQFNVNSQAKEQALSQFNSLLQSGALASATGSDIAQVAQATGLSTGMVQSAVGKSGVSIEKLGPNNNGDYTFVMTRNGQVVGQETIPGAGTAKTPTVVPNSGLAPGQVLVQNPNGTLSVQNTTAIGGTNAPTKIGNITYQYDPATGTYQPYQGQGGLLNNIMSTLLGPQPLTTPGVNTGATSVSPTQGESAMLKKLTVSPPKVNKSSPPSNKSNSDIMNLKLQF